MEFSNFIFYPGSVVEYKAEFYLLWNVNKFGKAQLIDKNGVKFSGTPASNRLTWISQVPVVEYANRRFAVDKNKRIFSTTTGNQVYKTNCPERKKILSQLPELEIMETISNYKMGFITRLEYNRQIYDFHLPVLA